MEFAKDRSWASTFGGVALTASVFAGCAAEKPIPVQPEALQGPDVALLLDRRVLVPGTLQHIMVLDDTVLVPQYVGTPNGMMLTGFISIDDTDYLYSTSIAPLYDISTVGTIRTEHPIHETTDEVIPASVSGVLRKDESGKLYLNDMRLEAHHRQAERE